MTSFFAPFFLSAACEASASTYVYIGCLLPTMSATESKPLSTAADDEKIVQPPTRLEKTVARPTPPFALPACALRRRRAHRVPPPFPVRQVEAAEPAAADAAPAAADPTLSAGEPTEPKPKARPLSASSRPPAEPTSP